MHSFASMKPIIEPRWDDIALAVLLLLIGVPRALLAVFYDRPLGAEGTLAIGSEPLFSDGFESGDVGAWTTSVP